MFLFYHSEQNPDNSSYFKGKLFEELLKIYLEKLGYVVEMRLKKNSLEYDLTGTAKLGGHELVGEAKAHEKPISGQDFSSFVGKIYPLHAQNPNLLGLYLSTSSLTPDATDFLGTLENTPLKISVSTGDKLMHHIVEVIGLPRVETLSRYSANMGIFPLSVHFLMTDRGPFLIQIAADAGGATPAWFVVMRQDGQVVNDRAFLSAIQTGIGELRELNARVDSTRNGTGESARKEIPEGLIVGNDWVDYRLPTSPEVFIGRRAVVDKLIGKIFETNGTPVIQVKSRSGVGKSSLLAFVCDQLQHRNDVRAQLYDVRNIKSVLDLLSVIQRVTGENLPAVDLGEMEQQLRRIQESNVRHVLLLDQFESTFANPDLYDAYESIAQAALKYRPWLTVILARKSDLLTTYDNSRISLERLNGVSDAIALEDFNAEEAVYLIERIGSQAGRKISADIKAYVLEFARGFPWLLKRTMAHVLRLLGRGIHQSELIPAALKLDDLFDEELEELDEIERDYLVRVAQRLPATYQDLDRAFEEDKHLPEVLEKLTRSRLLRLSGSTYDTYNDVFKDYLVFKKLPDFRVSFTYRLGPASVIRPFQRVSELPSFKAEELSGILGVAQGSAFNIIRELRNLGLIEKDGDRWLVPEVVTESYGRGRLGEYIRHRMIKNGVVADLVGELQTQGTMRTEALAEFLRDRFPFIIATANTWSQYANTLKTWLKTVKLIVEKNGELSLPQVDRATIAMEIGNLKLRLQARGAGIHFLPGAYWSHVESLYEAVASDGISAGLSVKQKDALRTLQELGICKEDGSFTVRSFDELISASRARLTGETYEEFWTASNCGGNLDEVLKEKFGLATLQPSTVVWRRKLLINWGKALGILGNRNRRRIRRKADMPMLEFD